VPYKGTDFADPDSDGDKILDGADDIDRDGYSNLAESDRDDPGVWVQPFNPCLPNPGSPFCSWFTPLEGDVWAPMDRPPFDTKGSMPPYCVPLTYPFVWPQVPAAPGC
jgi:hypothetical protein